MRIYSCASAPVHGPIYAIPADGLCPYCGMPGIEHPHGYEVEVPSTTEEYPRQAWADVTNEDRLQ